MKSSTQHRNTHITLALLLSFFLFNKATAQYELTKFSIHNGGGKSQNTAQDIRITGTIGQHDAAMPLSGSGYKLSGGFWTESTMSDLLFKNGFE